MIDTYVSSKACRQGIVSLHRKLLVIEPQEQQRPAGGRIARGVLPLLNAWDVRFCM